MKRLAFVLASVLLATGVWAQGAPAADTIMVVGSVVNSVDNHALPYCKVFLLQDGRHIATGKTDDAGHYRLHGVTAGDYSLVITQFADTLQHCKGLMLRRDTRMKSIVNPPQYTSFADYGDERTAVDGIVWLRPITVSTPGIMLRRMGLLITSADDPRLWNFSGKLGAGSRAAHVAVPLKSSLEFDESIAHLPRTLQEFLTFGKKLYITPPIWEICHDTYTPAPRKKAGETANKDEEE